MPSAGGRRSQRTTVLTVAAAVLALLVGVLAGRALPSAPEESSVDVGFARDMSTHHAQAVGMATTAVQRLDGDVEDEAEVDTLALDILLTQQNQVGRMQSMLISWGRSLAAPGQAMRWMHPDGGTGHGHEGRAAAGSATMPGMATPAELAELQELDGRALQLRFLQLMLRHHEGGLEMAETARDRATTEQVRNLAGAIAAGQRQESKVLEDLLRERGGEPLPLEGS